MSLSSSLAAKENFEGICLFSAWQLLLTVPMSIIDKVTYVFSSSLSLLLAVSIHVNIECHEK